MIENPYVCRKCSGFKATALSAYCTPCAMALRAVQVGGDHYSKHVIQPWDVIEQYGLNYWAGNVLKYVLRYKDKNGVEDLKKARHFLDKLIEYTGDDA